MPDYMTRREVGDLINIDGATVGHYMKKYATKGNPFPAPDVYLGRIPGWSADRADEIKAWAAARPGRTGRPRKTTTDTPPTDS